MDIKKYSFIFISALFILVSCKKDPVTRPVEFNTTVYDTLGTFNSDGKPGSLLPKDPISPTLQAFLDTTLPESIDLRGKHPELLNNKAIADIAITQKSDVFITFISEKTRFHNTFAYYTYPTNSSPATAADIKKITYVFPNAGQSTPLISGDKIKIGNFSPGTSIGFVLLQDAWNMSNYSLNSKAVHFCSNDVLNPEIDVNLKKHAVLINYPSENKVLIGFEDNNRTDPSCDNDFNDLLVYCTVKP